jgi:hypothetical protein
MELRFVTKGRPGPAWHSRIFIDRARCGVSGRVRHKRPAGSLVPYTGGTEGTVVLWFLTRAERGLEEERCAVAGERRGGGGQRKEEKKKREERS